MEDPTLPKLWEEGLRSQNFFGLEALALEFLGLVSVGFRVHGFRV